MTLGKGGRNRQEQIIINNYEIIKQMSNGNDIGYDKQLWC